MAVDSARRAPCQAHRCATRGSVYSQPPRPPPSPAKPRTAMSLRTRPRGPFGALRGRTPPLAIDRRAWRPLSPPSRFPARPFDGQAASCAHSRTLRDRERSSGSRDCHRTLVLVHWTITFRRKSSEIFFCEILPNFRYFDSRIHQTFAKFIPRFTDISPRFYQTFAC